MATTDSEGRVLSPTGVCGSGFLETSFEAALGAKPDVIGCDAGSTDAGPAYLGTGRTAFPRDAIKRNFRIMLRREEVGRSLTPGSCGTADVNSQVGMMAELAKEVAAAEGLRFKMALIHAEQGKDYLKKRLWVANS